MSEILNPSPKPIPRGHPWIAWLIVLAVSGGLIYLQNVDHGETVRGAQKQAAQATILELQAKLQIATPEFTKLDQPPQNDEDRKKREDEEAKVRQKVIESAERLNRGSIDQRLCALIVLGEIAGPSAAKEGLDKLVEQIKDSSHEPTETESKLIDILTRLYTDYVDGRPAAPTVTPEEREELKRHLDWFGRLALASKDPDGEPNPRREAVLAEARNSMLGFVGMAMVFIVLFSCGCVGLFVLGILHLKGVWKSRLGQPVAHHGVYAETFAIWFVTYLTMMLFASGWLNERMPRIFAMIAPMAASMAVLAWPVLRGIPWKQVRHDVGLTLGPKPFLEPTLGIVSYANSLPFAVAGLVVTLILLSSLPQGSDVGGGDPFRPEPSLAHPLFEQLRHATAADILPFFLLMSVAAPIMEETFFRGFLYRHLRDATYGWPLGATLSALITGILFAAVHPQGILAIPPLASLACGFTLAREWRGTLIPSIIAHGIHNSLILAVAILCVMKW